MERQWTKSVRQTGNISGFIKRLPTMAFGVLMWIYIFPSPRWHFNSYTRWHLIWVQFQSNGIFHHLRTNKLICTLVQYYSVGMNYKMVGMDSMVTIPNFNPPTPLHYSKPRPLYGILHLHLIQTYMITSPGLPVSHERRLFCSVIPKKKHLFGQQFMFMLKSQLMYWLMRGVARIMFHI